jgi:excisionase family DNA binding protein
MDANCLDGRAPSTTALEVSPVETELLRVEEAAKYLNLGRSKLYQLIAEKRLPVIRIDRSVRISRSALLEWIEKQAQATGSKS